MKRRPSPVPNYAPVGVILVAIVVVLTACSGGDETGPGEVHWDRDTCARCVMALSDRHYSAQVRGGPAGERTRLYLFDDIGCAVLWLAEQQWQNDPRTEIWVTDWRDGQWIEARKAWYLAGKTTPMDFGLGAQLEPADAALDFAAAGEHIRNRKQKAH